MARLSMADKVRRSVKTEQLVPATKVQIARTVDNKIVQVLTVAGQLLDGPKYCMIRDLGKGVKHRISRCGVPYIADYLWPHHLTPAQQRLVWQPYKIAAELRPS